MRILSIDPGFDKLGYAIIESSPKPAIILSGLIKTNRNAPPQDRLMQIYTELLALAKKEKPDLIVCEKVFFFKNQKTVIPVAQSQGIVLLIAAQISVPCASLSPTEIKQAITGYGTSDKQGVLKMLRLQFGHDLAIEDDDESDAIACGLAYAYLNNHPY